MNVDLAGAVAVVVVHTRNRPVDGNLLKVGAAMAVDLCIQVREDAALKEWIVREIDAADNMTRLKLDEISTSTSNPRFRYGVP